MFILEIQYGILTLKFLHDSWLFCLMQNFHLSACSFNSFFPT